MNFKTGFVMVLLSGIALAGVGAVLGAAIGWFAPAYYRIMFNLGDLPDFNLVSFGIVLGATQGFVVGVVISLIVLALLVWREISLASKTSATLQQLEKQ